MKLKVVQAKTRASAIQDNGSAGPWTLGLGPGPRPWALGLGLGGPWAWPLGLGLGLWPWAMAQSPRPSRCIVLDCRCSGLCLYDFELHSYPGRPRTMERQRDHQVHQKFPQAHPRVSLEGTKCDPRGMPKAPKGASRGAADRRAVSKVACSWSGLQNGNPQIRNSNNDFLCFHWVCRYDHKS